MLLGRRGDRDKIAVEETGRAGSGREEEIFEGNIGREGGGGGPFADAKGTAAGAVMRVEISERAVEMMVAEMMVAEMMAAEMMGRR